jgi:hypothetical protein
MDNDQDELRRLYQRYAAGPRPRDRERCPSPTEMVESFEPAASRHRKGRIIDHIAACPSCREEFLVLLEGRRRAAESIPSAGLELDAEASTRASLRRDKARFPLWRLAGAVAGLSLVIVSIVAVKHQWELSKALRSVRPGIALLAPRTSQSVSKPITFRWKSQTPAESYILELFDDALLPVWTSDKLFASEIQIPPEVASSLFAGRTYYWMVTGFSGRDKAGESPIGRFTVHR